MPINWKNRATKLKQDFQKMEVEFLAHHERSIKFGFALVKEKDARRRATQDYMNAQQKLMRAITAIEATVETFMALRQYAHAATFRMIANDLRPRDACGAAPQTNAEDEQH